MTQPNPDRLERIESLLENLTQDVEGFKHLAQDFEGFKQETNKSLEELKNETLRTNDKVEIYQKASQQLVNLAFSLIIAASLAIILPAILNR